MRILWFNNRIVILVGVSSTSASLANVGAVDLTNPCLLNYAVSLTIALIWQEFVNHLLWLGWMRMLNPLCDNGGKPADRNPSHIYNFIYKSINTVFADSTMLSNLKSYAYKNNKWRIILCVSSCVQFRSTCKLNGIWALGKIHWRSSAASSYNKAIYH